MGRRVGIFDGSFDGIGVADGVGVGCIVGTWLGKAVGTWEGLIGEFSIPPSTKFETVDICEIAASSVIDPISDEVSKVVLIWPRSVTFTLSGIVFGDVSVRT